MFYRVVIVIAGKSVLLYAPAHVRGIMLLLLG